MEISLVPELPSPVAAYSCAASIDSSGPKLLENHSSRIVTQANGRNIFAFIRKRTASSKHSAALSLIISTPAMFCITVLVFCFMHGQDTRDKA